MDKSSHSRAPEHFHNENTSELPFRSSTSNESSDHHQRRHNKTNDTITKYEESNNGSGGCNTSSSSSIGGSNNSGNKYRFDMNRNEKIIDNYKNYINHPEQQHQQRDNNERKNPFRSRNKFGKITNASSNTLKAGQINSTNSNSIKSQHIEPTPTLFEGKLTISKDECTNFDNRNSTNLSAAIKLPLNFELLAPRLQKQYFLKNGIDPDILTKTHTFKEHPQFYRHQKDRIRGNSSLRNSPDIYQPQQQQQQQQSHHPHHHHQHREKQQQQQSIRYDSYDREKDNHKQYANYCEPSRRKSIDKTVYNKIERTILPSLPPQKFNDPQNSISDPPNTMTSSGRAIVYDNKTSNDYQNIKITKRMDWTDDLCSLKDTRKIRRSDDSNISNRNNNPVNNTNNNRREIRDKESYRIIESSNSDRQSMRNQRSHRNEDVKSLDSSDVNLTATAIGFKLKIHNESTSNNSNNTPGIIRVTSPMMMMDQHQLSRPQQQQQLNAKFKTEIEFMHKLYLTEIRFNNLYVRPQWYDEAIVNDLHHNKHKPQTLNLLKRLVRTDSSMQELIASGNFLQNWHIILDQRQQLQDLFEQFLQYDMKLCREENVEQHFWKILYYNFFELFKSFKAILPADMQTFCNETAIELVENGLICFEKMIHTLEMAYKFRMNDYTGLNAGASIKGLKYLSLAIVSAQKLCLFMGDLYRYREQFLNTKNFGKAKQWYVKAQQLVPSNGIPYNQLAVLSLYTKRKFDAVYYHTRSLTSSNPIHSAKESLKVLFDEIRKKYEINQLKHEKRQKESKQQQNQQQQHYNLQQRSGDPLRRETWIHPEGGPKIYRTEFLKTVRDSLPLSSDEDECNMMDSIELSKRFTTSYLHVHGKLITKIGMESFMQCATQMLKEFRILLRHSPIVLTAERLIRLMALNMFAIENASTSGSIGKNRSEIQGFALTLALTMFGIILERFHIIVRSSSSFNDDENLDRKKNISHMCAKKLSTNSTDPIELSQLSEDSKVILPAIKIWCDWLVRHIQLWKPSSPCIDSFIRLNPWKALDELGAIAENTKITSNILSTNQNEDYTVVRLPEDISLLGFTPLLSNEIQSNERFYCSPDEDMDMVYNSLRFQAISTSIIFLRRHCDLTEIEQEQATNNLILLKDNDSDILLESFSDNEDFDISTMNKELDKTVLESMTITRTNSSTLKEPSQSTGQTIGVNDGKSAEIRKLLRRKDELERRHRMQEKQNQRLQEILNQRPILLNIEVRPKYIVPDTNCYIDFLDQIKLISNVYPLYYVVVPLVVINELEGLSRGAKVNVQNQNEPIFLQLQKSTGKMENISTSTAIGTIDAQHHNIKVASAALSALTYLKSKDSVIKICTTKGSFLNSTVFTNENDSKCDKISNDDKILLTALNLCKNHADRQKGEFQCIVREVVLLTTDRNLRVKALSQNVPVREVPDFIKWSGLGA